MTPLMIGPIPYTSAGADEASAADRQWFASHPDLSMRVRPLIPGELPAVAAHDGYTHVRVLQLCPGFRLRVPLRLEGPAGMLASAAAHKRT